MLNSVQNVHLSVILQTLAFNMPLRPKQYERKKKQAHFRKVKIYIRIKLETSIISP
jgi:hypothetical protein